MSDKAKAVITNTRAWEMEREGKILKGTTVEMLLYVKGNSFPIPHSMTAKDGLIGSRAGDQFVLDVDVVSTLGKATLQLSNFVQEKAS
jgi:hypothetical protein